MSEQELQWRVICWKVEFNSCLTPHDATAYDMNEKMPKNTKKSNLKIVFGMKCTQLCHLVMTRSPAVDPLQGHSRSFDFLAATCHSSVFQSSERKLQVFSLRFEEVLASSKYRDSTSLNCQQLSMFQRPGLMITAEAHPNFQTAQNMCLLRTSITREKVPVTLRA
jgi:hypothetical protein